MDHRGNRWLGETRLSQGLSRNALARFKRSAVYEPIVTRDMFEKARKAAKRRVESVEIVAPRLSPRGS